MQGQEAEIRYTLPLPPAYVSTGQKLKQDATDEVRSVCCFRWYAWRDSNPRPQGPQPCALSAELQAHEVQHHHSKSTCRRGDLNSHALADTTP